VAIPSIWARGAASLSRGLHRTMPSSASSRNATHDLVPLLMPVVMAALEDIAFLQDQDRGEARLQPCCGSATWGRPRPAGTCPSTRSGAGDEDENLVRGVAAGNPSRSGGLQPRETSSAVRRLS
jgi:hypothetical protein